MGVLGYEGDGRVSELLWGEDNEGLLREMG